MKKRVLFVSENVTLAQVVRLVTLARALENDGVDVHFASSTFPELMFGTTKFARHEIETLPAERADRALRSGRRLYEKSTLVAYIAAEVKLIERVQPDLVVGDFRWSVPASAELCGVPSAVLINAYWSPFAAERRFPVPDHPIVHWLGESLTEQYFPRAIPRVFRHFADPLNAARRHFGLRAVGSLLEVLTHGDHTLYPDDPGLTPVRAAPPSHEFIGPVLWQPDLPELDGLGDPAGDRPLIYVTLGSSGAAELLPMIVAVLAQLPVTAVVATADRVQLPALPENVIARSFVRGADVARRARLVISNGGSTTGYQALAEGTPVLGLPSNLDQYLATEAIVRAGAGRCVKARRATADMLRSEIHGMLEDGALQAAARRVAARFRALDAGHNFRAFVQSVFVQRALAGAETS
ncbi:MAG TPA: nucleotide disphospho-sugar-binding domain-containing protein [Polyangiaceae bacterium]|nr:nucleotide disphospho-sugar-binding domain-containing protein [Polyangiaceae bacterium]